MSGGDLQGPKFASHGKRDPNAFPIDEKAFDRIARSGLNFIKDSIGIQDDDEFKQHIVAIQKEAYQVFPYMCIRYYGFAIYRAPTVPDYEQFVKLGRERPGAILLDLGCCFGTDTRRISSDGWPAENIVASDIHGEFWKLGHKLFRSTPETFPAIFIAGDALDPTHLEVGPILQTPPNSPAPALNRLTSLNQLRGHVSGIYTGAFFHLFSEEHQAQIARALAGLLSPVPGSMITGMHSAAEETGVRTVARGTKGPPITQFAHSPESWTALWNGEVFPKNTVKVDATLRKYSATDGTEDIEYVTLHWSVTRL